LLDDASHMKRPTYCVSDTASQLTPLDVVDTVAAA
jgi:hypothetical protein